MNLFLDANELADLTGLRQPSAQIRWLQKNGVTHYVRADGQPRVPRALFEPPATPATTAATEITVPNFAALRARH